MKKAALLIATIYFLLTPSGASAQDFNSEKAYSDYQYQFTIYQQALSDFYEARDFYLKNPTLQLKVEARRKTLAMLKEREKLVTVYLTLLRMKLLETSGFSLDEKNTVFAKIDSEIDWYKNQASKYSDSDEPIDLFNKSDESKSRLETITIPIIYEALFDTTLSQEIGLRVSHQQTFADLKKYIDDQVQTGRLKIDPFNRWLNDTDFVLQSLQNNELKASAKFQTIFSETYGYRSIYRQAIEILSNSIDPLLKLNSYLTEMLTSIQNQMQ